jgi:protein-disulfide isomerase
MRGSIQARYELQKVLGSVMHGISKAGFSFVLTTLLLILPFSSTILAQPLEEETKQDSASYSNNPVVALSEGEPILLDDLKNAQIHEMMVRLYQMQRSLLKQKVIKSLVETHPELKSDDDPQITQKDVEGFYLNEPGIKELGSLEQLQGQIRNYLEKMQGQGYMRNLEARYQMAVEKGWVVDYFKPPNDFRLKASVGSAVLWFKDQNAQIRKVFVMEYSDFLCPFCKKVQRTLSDLRKKYADTVQFGYRHFPLHEEARGLSEAVECARDQGRFWQLQSLVFLNARRLQQSKSELIRNAQRAGVRDIPSFERCVDSGKYQKRIQSDLEEGVSLGIQGTPTFIIGTYNYSTSTINGEMFSGAVDPSKFINLIEKYLNHSE